MLTFLQKKPTGPVYELWMHDDETNEEHFIAAFLDEKVFDHVTSRLLDTYRNREILWAVLTSKQATKLDKPFLRLEHKQGEPT